LEKEEKKEKQNIEVFNFGNLKTMNVLLNKNVFCFT